MKPDTLQTLMNVQDKFKAGEALGADEKTAWLQGIEFNIRALIPVFPRIKKYVEVENFGKSSKHQLDTTVVADCNVACDTGLAELQSLLAQTRSLLTKDSNTLADQKIADMHDQYRTMYRLAYNLLFEMEDKVKNLPNDPKATYWSQNEDEIKNENQAALVRLRHAVGLVAPSFPDLKMSLAVFNADQKNQYRIPDDKVADYTKKANAAMRAAGILIREIESLKGTDVSNEELEELDAQRQQLRDLSFNLGHAKIKDMQRLKLQRRVDEGTEPTLEERFPEIADKANKSKFAVTMREVIKEHKHKYPTPKTYEDQQDDTVIEDDHVQDVETDVFVLEMQDDIAPVSEDVVEIQDNTPAEDGQDFDDRQLSFDFNIPAKPAAKKVAAPKKKRFLGMKLPSFKRN